ncbi:MAG: hypothetical protein R2827_08470 [Bdellovibrionales bacterium]
MGSIADNDSGGRYGYRMSKAALNAAGKSLAVDLRPREITRCSIAPRICQDRYDRWKWTYRSSGVCSWNV